MFAIGIAVILNHEPLKLDVGELLVALKLMTSNSHQDQHSRYDIDSIIYRGTCDVDWKFN